MRKSRSVFTLATIVVIAVFASVLGFWGFMETCPADAATLRLRAEQVLANIWRTLTLFTGNSPPEDSYPNIKLAIARVLALIATAGAIIEFMVEFFSGRFNLLRGLLRRNHTIIVGCGNHGRLFLNDCGKDRSNKAVVVDLRDDAAIRDQASSSNAIFFVGDGLAEDVLLTSGLCRAKRLLIFCGDDSKNLAILDTALKCQKRRSGKLNIVVGIDDAMLARELNRDDKFARGEHFEAVAFNSDAVAARSFLAHHPLADQAELRAQTEIRVACVGWSPFALAFMEQLARLSPASMLGKPTLILLAKDIEKIRSEIAALQPALNELLNLELVGLEGHSRIPTRESMIAAEQGARAPLTATLVTAPDDTSSVALALAIRDKNRRYNLWNAPIYVRTRDRSVLTRILNEAASDSRTRQIIPIGMTADICRIRAFFTDRDSTARNIHASYLAFKGIDANLPAVERAPNEQLWDNLAQTFRQGCRRAADHLPIKLLSAGIIQSDSGTDRPQIGLGSTEDELEMLSDIEHQSWRIDRRLDGWQFGEVRDNEARHHPAMVPYQELPEEVRDFDRDQIRVAADMLIRSDSMPISYRECRIGVLGHNQISAQDEAEMLHKLEGSVLPGLLKTYGDRFVSVCTPLAPGSDSVITETVLKSLANLGIPHRLIVLKTLPSTVMIEDYLRGSEAGNVWTIDQAVSPDKDTLANTINGRLQEIARSAPQVYVADMITTTITRAEYRENNDARVTAYRQGGAWLAEKCDVLLAYCDDAREHGPGGTRETLSWASGETNVPDSLTTLTSIDQAKRPRVYRL